MKMQTIPMSSIKRIVLPAWAKPVLCTLLIDAWRKKQVSGTTLTRGLVSYREWLLLLSDAAVSETLASNSSPRLRYNISPDGKKRLPVFFNEQALKAAKSPYGDVSFQMEGLVVELSKDA
jgi:hypothetical protein